ncbi:MAG: SMP-30/gluconolactonase/LRE family protein [Niabella sp.]|nr:SMP-30/gluconolactonase/LRE family protein [Niabella sp.]
MNNINTIKTREARLLSNTHYLLGEGAAWHPQWRQFLCVDILGKKVVRVDPQSGALKETQLDKCVSAVVPAEGDRLLVALQGSLEELDIATGNLQEIITIEADLPGNRCNDGKCDASGRFWIGTMHVDAKDGQGALYNFDGESLNKVIGSRTISNGLAWSPDNKTMYYTDSAEHTIKAFDFDLETGTITRDRVIVEIMAANHMPDGICVDAEGMLWVAVWGAGTVHRYNPDNGMLLGKIIIDAPHVSNCAFGGKDMQQLFITTARSGLTASQLEQYPLSGGLFLADTGIKGMSGFPFKSRR